MTDDRIHCSVYRSPKKEGMYLFVPKKEPFEKVPEPLMQSFGTPGHVMDLELTPERKLVRANAPEIMKGLRENGYYLQMPPKDDEQKY